MTTLSKQQHAVLLKIHTAGLVVTTLRWEGTNPYVVGKRDIPGLVIVELAEMGLVEFNHPAGTWDYNEVWVTINGKEILEPTDD